MHLHEARLEAGAVAVIVQLLQRGRGQSFGRGGVLQELGHEELAGEDLSIEATADIKRLLIEGADAGGIVKDVHFVRARQTSSGRVVNYHCRVDPTLSVHDVHDAVDQIDRHLRRSMDGIIRVVGHADPLPR